MNFPPSPNRKGIPTKEITTNRLCDLLLEAGALLSKEALQLLQRFIRDEGLVIGWGYNRDGELGNGNQYNLTTPVMISGQDKPLYIACSGKSSLWLGVQSTVLTMGSGKWGELGVGDPKTCHQVMLDEKNFPICPNQVSLPVYSNKDILVSAFSGYSYFCCVSLSGHLYMWGANTFAQIEPRMETEWIGSPQHRYIPNERIVEVACANYSVIARTSSGSLYGWGLTQLLGETDLKDVAPEFLSRPDANGRQALLQPTKLNLLSSKEIILITAGPWHFAAVTKLGRVWTWGLGNNGRLGHGHERDVVDPTLVSTLEYRVVSSVACGSFHTVFVTADGCAYACGDNKGGQCGVLGEFTVPIPTLLFVSGNRKVVGAACCRHCTLLLLSEGDVVAYGSGLGLGTGAGYGLRLVRGLNCLQNYTSFALASGPTHAFALSIPKLTCLVILGMPHRGVSIANSVITLKEGLLHAALGSGFSILLSRRGNCYSLGYGNWGQLGIDMDRVTDYTPENVPVVRYATRISYFSQTNIYYVSAGHSFALALSESDRVFAWGNNSCGQCGLGIDPLKHTIISEPHEITWLSDKVIVQVSCGSCFALALSASGDVYSWGVIECCGHGLSPSPDCVPSHVIMDDVNPDNGPVILVPIKIKSLEKIIQIATGGWHAMALNAVGEIYAWGIGYGGRLGLGHNCSFYTPTRVISDVFFSRIGCGWYTSYGLTDTAQLYLWGVSEKGQLGVCDRLTRPTFIMGNVKEVGLAKYFTLILTYDGKFHFSGNMEHEKGSFSSESFADGRVPYFLQEISLEKENLAGIKIYCGVEHALVFLEKNRIASHTVEVLSKGFWRMAEGAICRKWRKAEVSK